LAWFHEHLNLCPILWEIPGAKTHFYLCASFRTTATGATHKCKKMNTLRQLRFYLVFPAVPSHVHCQMAPSTISSMYRTTAVAQQTPFKGCAHMQTHDLPVYSAVLSWLLQRSMKTARSFEIHKSMESIYHLTSSQKESRQDSSQRWCLCRASTRPFTTARRCCALIISSRLEAALLFLCLSAGAWCDRWSPD
jgi:hypothetical protein